MICIYCSYLYNYNSSNYNYYANTNKANLEVAEIWSKNEREIIFSRFETIISNIKTQHNTVRVYYLSSLLTIMLIYEVLKIEVHQKA
jgi:hypothetical protein